MFIFVGVICAAAANSVALTYYRSNTINELWAANKNLTDLLTRQDKLNTELLELLDLWESSF